MVTKPTKQQIEQGKARAGGNNPIKVTKAGVKGLGQAALIAASLTPIGRTAKIAGIIAKPISKVIQARSVKNTKVVVEKIAKMQEKARAEKIASNSVKLRQKIMNAQRTAPKTDLSNRGTRLTKAEAIDRARGYQWDKAETYMEQRFDTMAGGPRAGEMATAGPGKANARKAAAVRAQANQTIPKAPIKINSAPKQTTTKTEAKSNARNLKAANKPVSKNNRNRFGDGEMSAYLKSIR